MADPINLDDFDEIIFHFDGNNNDKDDIAAIPVAALLTKAAGIEDKMTFFYGNNLAEANASGREAKLDAGGDFAESFGIDAYNYQHDIQATTAALVDILSSGKKVLMIEGGPMEAAYRALEQTDPIFHENLTLLSHSSWNENRNTINNPSDPNWFNTNTSARTWSDIRDDFNVEMIDIRDQNDGHNNTRGFNNKNWDWMDDTSDPDFQEARDIMEMADGKVNDPSDAGMLYFALTGNDSGTPEDAQAYFEASGVFAGDGGDTGDGGSGDNGSGDNGDNGDGSDNGSGNDDVSLNFFIADTQTDEIIVSTFQDGDVIDASLLEGRSLTIGVEVIGDTAGSVAFNLGGHNQTENVVPYALFGDNNSDYKAGKIDLSSGMDGLNVTVYNGKNKSGGVLTSASDISFSVTSDDDPVDDPVDPIVVSGDVLSLAEDGQATVNVLLNDTGEGALTVDGIIDGPDHGTITVNSNGNITYTGGKDFHGTDSFTYVAKDSTGATATGVVSVTVTPVNDAPVANNDVATVQAGETVTIDVLANDSDVDNAKSDLDITITSQPIGSFVQVGDDGTIQFTASAESSGTQSLTYTVSDGAAVSNEATVSIDVIPAPSTGDGYVPEYLDFFFADANTNEQLDALEDGATYTSSDLLNRELTFSANISEEYEDQGVGSVKLSFEGYTRTENVEPYALFGDINGDYLRGTDLSNGTKELYVQVFEDSRGRGDLLEEFTLTFTIDEFAVL